ncbi:T9SS type A sorting domain-containing protein [Spirosoma sp. KUDC1026]|uniref:T9SS type A sorting domain-containing protein n=1 Tax=Spirosoma sp. KUDC1026 TaxID=2745947 RepID=UPI001E44AD9B|nr:T9SS type A sorting domain-containing protein [Spirosoma sp. KUDC1026]
MKSLLTTLVVCAGLFYLIGPAETHTLLASVVLPQTTGKIPIDAKRWYQLNNVTNGLDGLFDGNTQEAVNTGWNKLLANYDAYYPLLEGEQMTIERIRMYDGQGENKEAPVTLYIINDRWERIPIARFLGDHYNKWVGPDPGNPDNFDLKTPITGARYLVLNTSGAYPNELELYGTHQAGAAPSPTPIRPTPFRQMVGVNAFEWNLEDANAPWKIDESRIPAVKTFSSIRHYMDWEKLESTPGQYTFNPTGAGSWNYDALYERCKAEGITVLACLKTIPQWLENTYPAGERDNENVPAPYGRNLAEPASYIEQARVGFQFAARYGYNQKIDPALVKVSSVKTWAGINTQKIGLGLIRYIECENERDKTWKGRKAYQTAREYAANLSAFYDGHKNTLGPGVGIKNADPSMIVVIGGLAASSTDYVRGMIDWCREFRGLKPDGRVDLCWDVMNQHLYANDAASSQGGGSSRGAAPEVASVGEQAREFVKVAHQAAHDMPVWITEAGYDLNQGSPLKAIAIGSKSVQETQADWILRTALVYARVGIDRLFFYQLYDDNLANPTQFSSMGLINGDKTRKPAADYLYQVRNLLGDYRYQETLPAERTSGVVVDRYDLAGKSAFVLVVPDEHGRTTRYNLAIPKGDTVRICTPRIGSETMTQEIRVSTTGMIPLTVTETPIFVLPASGERIVDSGLATVQVYPNPAANYVDIVLENGVFTPVSIVVVDSKGSKQSDPIRFAKPVRQFRERLDLSDLPGGVYLLDIRQDQYRIVKKVIRTD